MIISTNIAARTFLAKNPATPKYAFVNASKPLLKAAKNLSNKPFLLDAGFNSMAASAGLKVSALSAENATETAIVIANCWYNLPVIPPLIATGINTAHKITAIAITGPPTSFIAFLVASLGLSPCSI